MGKINGRFFKSRSLVFPAPTHPRPIWTRDKRNWLKTLFSFLTAALPWFYLITIFGQLVFCSRLCTRLLFGRTTNKLTPTNASPRAYGSDCSTLFWLSRRVHGLMQVTTAPIAWNIRMFSIDDAFSYVEGEYGMVQALNQVWHVCHDNLLLTTQCNVFYCSVSIYKEPRDQQQPGQYMDLL